MIPYLFESTATTFTGHGIGDLVEATEVIAEENGEDGHEWELSFNYPETGELFSQLGLNKIVVAKANSYQNPQAFRIYSITKNINHMVTVACQHLSYDLANIPTKPIDIVGVADALNALKSNMINVCNSSLFFFPTDMTIVYSSSKIYKKGDIVKYSGVLYKSLIDIDTPEAWNSSHWTNNLSKAEKESVTVKFDAPKSALNVLLDGDDSIKGIYGGDIVTDNYTVSLYEVGGSDRNVSIEYGVDLVDLDQERNITEMITGILPYYVREKDIRLEIGLERESDVTDVGGSMALNTEAYTLEVGCKYTLKFTPEAKTGGSATLSAASGFPSVTFNMDGFEKEYEITPSSAITVAAGTNLITATTIPSEVVSGQTIYSPVGSINSFSIVKNYVEPIIYGDVVNGPGTYDIARISPVDLSEYFQDSNDEPTAAQVTSKGQEWLNKEEIGIPEVSLTVSYASLEGKDVRLYDAVRVIFSRMGIDVKSKITRYKYDVLAERCLEIDVGKTKESAIFTLQDASKLRKGLLPPDRIAKESIDGNKIKSGSVGSNQIAAGGVSKWNMPVDIIDHDLLGENAVSVRNLSKDDGSLPDGWCKDPVLQSVPANVYGGYSKKVGYLFDPSMGVPPDNLFGWTYTNPTTGEKVFKPITKWQQRIPYGQNSGVGYVLDPDFILDKDIDANKKVTDGTVTNTLIASGAIDETKLSDVVDPTTGRKNLKSKITAWENLHDNVGPEMDSWTEATLEGSSYINMPFLSVSSELYVTCNDIAMVGPSPQYGSYHFRPSILSVQNGSSAAVSYPILCQLPYGQSGISIVIPDVSSLQTAVALMQDEINDIERRLPPEE